MYPKLPVKEITKLVFKFGGATNPPQRVTALGTHRLGGSFDLTIVNQAGEELYMGTDHDDLTNRAATDYFEKKKNLNVLEKEAKKSRQLLKDVLIKAGFKNYPPEWWHWSWGK